MVFDAGGLWRQALLQKMNEERLADEARRLAQHLVPAGRIALQWRAPVAWLVQIWKSVGGADREFNRPSTTEGAGRSHVFEGDDESQGRARLAE